MARDQGDPVQLDGPQLVADVQLTTHQGCISLPVETIYHILRHLGPRDLIRLRAVSQIFREIIRDPALWRTVYSTARLPLPPGPFPWQSINFLQQTLVYSARLANTWTTEPLTLISSKIYTGPRSVDNDRFQWVCGRWLIVGKDMRQLRSRDVETGSERVLWDHGSFAHWGATSVIIPQGHFIYVAVHLEKGRLADPVTLLEFVVDDDTGYLSGPEMLDVPTWSLPREAFTPSIRVDGAIAPYDILLNYRGAWLPHLVEVYFTRTHLFVLSRSYLIHDHIGDVEVVQTFALSDVDANPAVLNSESIGDSPSDGRADSDGIVRELRLTHEMVTRDVRSMWLVPIRDATIDPVTQSTTLRFMHTYAPFYRAPDARVRLVCTDYTLPASHAGAGSISATAADNNNNHDHNNGNHNNSTNLNAIVRSNEDILPITFTSHDIFSVQGLWKGNLVDVSGDGFVRGLCMVEPLLDGGGSDTSDGMVQKFTVDATGERCVGVVGDLSLPWGDLDPSRHYEYALDGMRGKIWYTKGSVLERDAAGEPVDRDVLAIVVDFK